jgi:Protein-L-isoaspartate(D-aspartate) O-methyltransferase (PCMT)
LGFEPPLNKGEDAEERWGEFPDRSGPRNVTRKLARGELVSDLEFDRIYPSAIREASRIHWTPLSVARRAVELLGVTPGMRILDVGSGAGKFCIIGALVSEGIFTGIEQRESLVMLSRLICRRYEVPRAFFECCQWETMTVKDFAGYYLYNPFGENIPGTPRIDESVPIGKEIYRRYLENTELRLAEAAVGTRVVLYHGFGGQMPSSYRSQSVERRGAGYLELWVKER